MFNMPELALVEVLVLRYDNVQHARTSFSRGHPTLSDNGNVTGEPDINPLFCAASLSWRSL